MGRSRTATSLARVHRGDGSTRRPDEVLVEEPLEIRLGDALVTTTMRTPGHDYELAAGWCHAEGVLRGPDGAPVGVAGIRYCATGSAVDTGFNVVTVQPDGPVAEPTARLATATSSCGICGADAIDSLTERLVPLPPPATRFGAGILGALGAAVAGQQELFAATGGSHAAAACTSDGTVLVVREDIGRHNAVDKVVGRLLLDGALPADGLVLWVSGRASFEMVQKAWAAGFAALVSVSAVSSLAVATARRAGLVLCGFARGDRLTVYAGESSVTGGSVTDDAVTAEAGEAAP